jgi:predicted TPR repeat methyltransferase
MYRGIFVDLDAFVASTRASVTAPERILEIGCGDGLVTERLAQAFPGSILTGIDVCSQPGRLYRGDRTRVRFLRTSAAELNATDGARYQLVVVADVLHHVPHPQWASFLSSAAKSIADGGAMVLKDWMRERTPAYLMGYLSDRFVTGDRIRYPSDEELRSLVRATFGGDAIRREFRITPWHCNLALVISPKCGYVDGAAGRAAEHEPDRNALPSGRRI